MGIERAPRPGFVRKKVIKDETVQPPKRVAVIHRLGLAHVKSWVKRVEVEIDRREVFKVVAEF